MASYHRIRIMAEGVVILTHADFGQQMWTLGRLRKIKTCKCGCQRSLAVGSMVYRPITNGYNRAERIDEKCITKLSPAQT